MSPNVERMLAWRKPQGYAILAFLGIAILGVAGAESYGLIETFKNLDVDLPHKVYMAIGLAVLWCMTVYGLHTTATSVRNMYFIPRELDEANLTWFVSSRRFIAGLYFGLGATTILGVVAIDFYVSLMRSVDVIAQVLFVVACTSATWILWKLNAYCKGWVTKGIYFYAQEVQQQQINPLGGIDALRRPTLVRDATPEETREFRRAMRRMEEYEAIAVILYGPINAREKAGQRLASYIETMVLQRDPLKPTVLIETTDATGRVYRGIQEGIQWRHTFFDELNISAHDEPDPVTVSVVPHQKEG